MKKFTFVFILMLCSIFVSAQDTITLNNGVYRIDTLAYYPIGPGSTYTALQLTRTTGGLLHVYFSKVCRTNPYISFEVTVGRDSILLGETVSSQANRHSKPGHRLFTGTNGDFYNTSGDIGLPTSATVCNGEFAYSPNNSRNVMAFDENNMPMLADRITFTGTAVKGENSYPVSHVNYKRLSDQLVIYNRYQGRSTKTNIYGNEATMVPCNGEVWNTTGTIHCVVTGVNLAAGNTPIPDGGVVLSGHGAAADFVATLAAGDTVTISMATILDGDTINVSNSLGGDTRPFMLYNGVVETNIDNIWNENHPRTGFGYSQSGDTVIMCVVDGRGVSMGCTTYTLAEIMQSGGAYAAINLDGGGSSTHYVAPFGAMNRTSDGPERAVSNALFAVNTAPDNDTIAAIAPYYPNVYLPKYGMCAPRIMGYNKYGALINTDVTGYVLSCDDADVGHIDNNVFVASGTKNGHFTVSYGDAQCSVYVIQDNEVEIKIVLDSVIIDKYHPYDVDIDAVIGLNSPKVLSKALSWEVADPTVCEVVDGVVHALANGETMLVGSLGSFSDTLKVIVENPATNILNVEKWDGTTNDEWTLTSSAISSWKTTLVSATEKEAAHIDFTYASARSQYINLGANFRLFGLPDSIGFRSNTRGIELLGANISVRSNNNNLAQTFIFENINANAENELVVKVSDIKEYGSFAIYPLFVEGIRLNINSESLTEGNDYSIIINGLYLYYGNVVVTVTDFATDTQLDIYPNPATEFIYLPNECAGERYSFVDIEVRLVCSGVLTDTYINISGFAKGLYIINVNNKSSKIIIK